MRPVLYDVCALFGSVTAASRGLSLLAKKSSKPIAILYSVLVLTPFVKRQRYRRPDRSPSTGAAHPHCHMYMSTRVYWGCYLRTLWCVCAVCGLWLTQSLMVVDAAPARHLASTMGGSPLRSLVATTSFGPYSCMSLCALGYQLVLPQLLPSLPRSAREAH